MVRILPSGKGSTGQCRRHKRLKFDPWVGKLPWRRKWQPTPGCLPGEPHEQRGLAGMRAGETDSPRTSEGPDWGRAGQVSGWRCKALTRGRDQRPRCGQGHTQVEMSTPATHEGTIPGGCLPGNPLGSGLYIHETSQTEASSVDT